MRSKYFSMLSSIWEKKQDTHSLFANKKTNNKDLLQCFFVVVLLYKNHIFAREKMKWEKLLHFLKKKPVNLRTEHNNPNHIYQKLPACDCGAAQTTPVLQQSIKTPKRRYVSAILSAICMWTFMTQRGARLGRSNSGAVCYPPYSAVPNEGHPPPTHPAPQTELKMRNLEAGAEMSEDGIGVTWQAFISPFTTPCLWRHGGRRWEKEVQRLRAPGTDLISR